MKWVYDDGGRAAAGFKGNTRDCVCRAIAIATGWKYDAVYAALNQECIGERFTQGRRASSSRTGISKPITRAFLKRLGWVWHPTMTIGQGCRVHLKDGELPMGRVVAQASKHLVAVIDGVIHDTSDPSRGGTRCVYGYWQPTANNPQNIIDTQSTP